MSLFVDEPSVYINSVQSIIDRLNQKVSCSSKPEMEEPDMSPSLNFLDIVKSFKKDSEIASQIESDEDMSSVASSLEVSFSEEVCLQKSAESRSVHAKDESSMQELLRVVKLKHLFKCMARNGCSFSSDNAAKFRLHLEEVHANQVINSIKIQW